MKDLASLSKQEQKDFFSSFDYIFCDVDGVLWHLQVPIPGALEAIKTLKSLNKKVIFISNNNTKSHDEYFNQLTSTGYVLDQSELVLPVLAITDFLKKQNFNKEIYVIGMSALRTHLETAGFKIDTFDLDNPEESVPKYLKNCITVNENIGAVVVDIDLNMKMAQLQKAATYLKNKEVIFITGGQDKVLCFGAGINIIGPGMYHNILEDMCNRKSHCLAKPSPELNDFIVEKFNIKDKSKVLVIGDSVREDMGFASNCGYKKLLVLSGLTSKEEVEAWNFPEEYKPDYYTQSLNVINDIFSSK